MVLLIRHILNSNNNKLVTGSFLCLQKSIASRALFHTTLYRTDKHPTSTTTELSDEELSPVELLRKNAWQIEEENSLRSRCAWTKEETEKLMELIGKMGKRWTAISNKFIDRSPSNVMNRYSLLEDVYTRGPWTKEELEALRKLGDGRDYEQINNWEDIQKELPRTRPLFLIKQTYKHSLDPRIKHGRWTKEESEQLKSLVEKYGEHNMATVAAMMGSRTKRQCLERWRWQMSNVVKGRFTKEEDKLILDAVAKYGKNFAVVCKVTNLGRTPRHVSQHYQNSLDPAIDRSPWTDEEELKVYETCLEKKKNMVEAKEALKSKRAIRDMWNHFNRVQKKKNLLAEASKDL